MVASYSFIVSGIIFKMSMDKKKQSRRPKSKLAKKIRAQRSDIQRLEAIVAGYIDGNVKEAKKTLKAKYKVKNDFIVVKSVVGNYNG